MHILNKRQVKKLLKAIKAQFGISLDLDYVFLENDNNLYLASKDFNPDIKNIKSIGLHFAEIKSDGILLSIEGSQLIGKKASKNILELKDPANWIRGNDIKTTHLSGYVLIKYKDDFLGSGKASKDKIINSVPRLRASEIISS